ncbi:MULTISPECIES: YgdI/YgdR family lipoprotein [unclassified Serratia (in: enterobacteria)]|uniref:YgdI/YgdR family lipoprotein n=1 Tax=unclassified Serratia (in: enterobacteria) TaxID=2647522 RepID=UPI000468F2A1|nr:MULTISPECIES: YgdI/YgdR family lipoprotein [unclassified Serratia (in: enterobacteria)]
MKKLIFLPLIFLTLALAGCTSDYIITTKSGDILQAHGEPDTDRDSGMTSYTGMNGDYHLINTNDISGIVKK